MTHSCPTRRSSDLEVLLKLFVVQLSLVCRVVAIKVHCAIGRGFKVLLRKAVDPGFFAEVGEVFEDFDAALKYHIRAQRHILLLCAVLETLNDIDRKSTRLNSSH